MLRRQPRGKPNRYLAKRIRRDIFNSVSFLSTRLNSVA